MRCPGQAPPHGPDSAPRPPCHHHVTMATAAFTMEVQRLHQRQGQSWSDVGLDPK